MLGMPAPFELLRLVEQILVDHYRQRHPQDKPEHALVFADALYQKLFGYDAVAHLNHAVTRLDIPDLPCVWVHDDDCRLAANLRFDLCRAVQQWLLGSVEFRYNAEDKALAYARTLAGLLTDHVYTEAISRAKAGPVSMIDPDDDLSPHERLAREAERRYG